MKIHKSDKIIFSTIAVVILILVVLYKIKGKELFLNYSTSIEYFCTATSPDEKYVYYLADITHNRTIKGMNAMNLYGPQLHESLLMRINNDGIDKRIILKMPDTYWPYLLHLHAVMDITLDGTKIAYSPAPGRGIWIVDTDGTNNMKVVDLGTNPSWSPDGLKIVYENEKIIKTNDGGERGVFYETEKGGISIIDLKNNNIQVIKEDKNTHKPKWSTNGRYIAFQSISGMYSKEYASHIFIYDLVKQNTWEIIGKGEMLFWSKKADKIYYTGLHSNFDEIYLGMENIANNNEDSFIRYGIDNYYDSSNNPNYLLKYNIKTNKVINKIVLEKNVKKLIY